MREIFTKNFSSKRRRGNTTRLIVIIKNTGNFVCYKKNSETHKFLWTYSIFKQINKICKKQVFWLLRGFWEQFRLFFDSRLWGRLFCHSSKSICATNFIILWFLLLLRQCFWLVFLKLVQFLNIFLEIKLWYWHKKGVN